MPAAAKKPFAKAPMPVMRKKIPPLFKRNNGRIFPDQSCLFFKSENGFIISSIIRWVKAVPKAVNIITVIIPKIKS